MLIRWSVDDKGMATVSPIGDGAEADLEPLGTGTVNVTATAERQEIDPASVNPRTGEAEFRTVTVSDTQSVPIRPGQPIGLQYIGGTVHWYEKGV